MDHPSTAERRGEPASKAQRESDARDEPIQGLTEEPTSPRENPPTDDDRIERAIEDFERVLGN
jgi:hypothetical protein